MTIARLMQMAAAGVPRGPVWLADLANASYDGVFYNASSQDNFVFGLFASNDGLNFYFVGNAGQDINQLSLSTAWDLSTASFVRSFSVAPQETSPQGVFFKSDGTKMYVIGTVGDDVNEYSLSSAWDISTASFVQNFSIAAKETVGRNLYFSDDGILMFIVGSASDSVHKYSLSTAWDISTASFLQTFSVSTEDGNPYGLFFAPDGLSMYVVGRDGQDVNEYTLASAWDITTVTYARNFSVSAQETAPFGISFKSDGTKMYISGFTGDNIYQYSTA